MKCFIALLMGMMVVSGEVWATRFDDAALRKFGPIQCPEFFGSACIPVPFWLSIGPYSIAIGLFAIMALYGVYRTTRGVDKFDKYFIILAYILVFISLFFLAAVLLFVFAFIQIAAVLAYIVLKLTRIRLKRLWWLACALGILSFIWFKHIDSTVSKEELWLAISIFSASFFLNTMPYEAFLYCKRLPPRFCKPVATFVVVSLMMFMSFQLYKTHVDYKDYLAGLPRLAAEGNHLAQYRMAEFYEAGSNGFQQSYEDAYFWLNLSGAVTDTYFSFASSKILSPTTTISPTNLIRSVEGNITPEQKTNAETRAAAWKLAHSSEQ